MADDLVKLRAENAELRSQINTVQIAAKYAAKIRDERIEKLEAALRKCSCDCVSNCSADDDLICESWSARKALEGKDD